MGQWDYEMLGSGYFKFEFDYLLGQNLAAGDAVSSENFSAGGYLWRINCYPCGHRIDGNRERLSIFMQLMSEAKKDVKAILDCLVVGRDGTLDSPDPRVVHVFRKGSIESGWPHYMKRSGFEQLYVINGMVTLVCGVIVVSDKTLREPLPSNLASHLCHLLDRALGTDVSFIVGSETFPAHRAVLAARSPVFAAKLFGSMAEARMPSITLQDIDTATFKVMLRFMYTDALPADDEFGDSLVDMMMHLLAAADRYALDRLKVMCERKLLEIVSVETVASVLACAETYSCPTLKIECIHFLAVKENFIKAFFKDGFAMLLHKFPALAAELERCVGT